MAVSLNRTGNPINREERILLNQNWDKIEMGIYTLQHEINMLAGDADVEDILEAITTALDRINEVKENVDQTLTVALNARDKAEQAVLDAQTAIATADVSAEEAHKATLAANEATEKANKATEDANKALTEMSDLMDTMNLQLNAMQTETESLRETAKQMIEQYDESKVELINFMQDWNTKAQQAVEDNKDLTNKMITDARKDVQDAIDKLDVDTEALIKRVNDAIKNSRQATAENKVLVDNAIDNVKLTVSDAVAQGNLDIAQSLEQNKKDVAQLITDTNSKVDIKIGEVDKAIRKAELATTGANEATAKVNEVVKEVQGWTGAEEFDRNKDYFRNNVVTYNGSTWQARRNVMGVTPSEDNKEDWILLARKGIDGQGAVASVNGLFPDTKGNIKLEAHDVDAYNRKEIDDKLKEVADNTNLITEELEKHNGNFLAHGGYSVFSISNPIVNSRLYKDVVYEDERNTTTQLSESNVGSGVYNILTVFTKDEEGNDLTLKYKLKYNVSGAVVGVSRL